MKIFRIGKSFQEEKRYPFLEKCVLSQTTNPKAIPEKKFFAILEKGTHTQTTHLHRTYDKIVVVVVVVVQAITPSHRLLPLSLSLSNLIDKQRKVTDRVSWNFRVVALRSLLLFLGAFSSE